jgi:hypothetical protein
VILPDNFVPLARSPFAVESLSHISLITSILNSPQINMDRF